MIIFLIVCAVWSRCDAPFLRFYEVANKGILIIRKLFFILNCVWDMNSNFWKKVFLSIDTFFKERNFRFVYFSLGRACFSGSFLKMFYCQLAMNLKGNRGICFKVYLHSFYHQFKCLPSFCHEINKTCVDSLESNCRQINYKRDL